MILALNLLMVIITLFMATLALLYKQKVNLYKLHNDLVEWISIGIGQDIVRLKDQRKEYQSYVRSAAKYKSAENIPNGVVIEMRKDLDASNVFRMIYIKLIYVELTRLIGR